MVLLTCPCLIACLPLILHMQRYLYHWNNSGGMIPAYGKTPFPDFFQSWNKYFVALHPLNLLLSFPGFFYQSHSHTCLWVGPERVILLVFHNSMIQSKTEVVRGDHQFPNKWIQQNPILMMHLLLLISGRLHAPLWSCFYACSSVLWRSSAVRLDPSAILLCLSYDSSGCNCFLGG